MCLSPIRIKNPNYGLKSSLSFLKDTTSAYINIPCGYCSECVASKQMAIVQRVQMESLDHHIFFCTLTYNDESLPVLVTSTGYHIRYADVSDVQNMMKRLRKYNAFGRAFRYLAVSELGGKKGRPHFHILFFVDKYEKDSFYTCMNLEKIMHDAVLKEWRRNYGSTKHPDYRPLCTYVQKIVRGQLKSTFDLHFVNSKFSDAGQDDVSFYVSKYMLKKSQREESLQQALKLNLPIDEYLKVWPIVKSRMFKSLGFGRNPPDREHIKETSHAILVHLKESVKRSKYNSDFAKFYTLTSGKTFPLCHYYKRFPDIYSMDDHLTFFYNSDVASDNMIYDNKHISKKLLEEEQFNKKRAVVDGRDESININTLF